MTQMTFADVFSGISEDDISFVLRKGSGFEGGKGRIYAFFSKNKNTKERAEFLKNEYGIGGMAPIFWDFRPSGVDYDAKGLTITKMNEQRRFSWPEVAERIGALINENRYKELKNGKTD